MADLAKLVVRMEGENAKLISKLEQSTRKTREYEKATSKSIDGVKKAFAGLIAVVGVRQLASGFKTLLESADRIAKTADSIGLGTDEWQRYAYAAERSGLETDAMAKALQGATARVGQLRENTGSLYTYLQRYDETLLKNIQTSRSSKEALDQIFAAIANGKDSLDKAAIAGAAFGLRAGPQMAILLKDGVKGLDELKKSATGVLSDELLRRAEYTNDRFTDMKRIIGAELTTAMSNLAPIILTVSGGLTDLVSGGGAEQGLPEWAKVAAFTVHKLGEEFVDLGDAIGAAAAILDLKIGPGFFDKYDAIIEGRKQKRLALEKEDEKFVADLNKRFSDQNKGGGAHQNKGGGAQTGNGVGSGGSTTEISAYIKQQAELESQIRAVQTPVENTTDSIIALNAQWNAGLISTETYTRSIERLPYVTKSADEGNKEFIANLIGQENALQNARTGVEKYGDTVTALTAQLQAGQLEGGDAAYIKQLQDAQDQFLQGSKQTSIDWTDIWSSAFNRFAAGVGDTVGRAVVEQQNLTDAMHSVLRGVAEQVISTLTEIGVKEAALWVLRKANLIADTAITTTAATTSALAWAPAAAAASLATLGTNAAPAAAALSSTFALSEGLAVAGIADHGLDYVPGQGTYMLNKGERVVSPQDNQVLTKALRDGKFGGGMAVNLTINASAIDARGIDRILASRSSTIVAVIQNAYRQRGRVGGPIQ